MTNIPLTYFHLKQYVQNALKDMYSPKESIAISRQFVEDLSGLSWFAITADREKGFTTTQLAIVQRKLSQLLDGMPIQYVNESAHFYGRVFQIGPKTLIPRQETEELMCWARNILLSYPLSKRSLNIWDIGTGSGCIAISLLCELKDKEIGNGLYVLGSDVSLEALRIAYANGALCNYDGLRLAQTDIFWDLSIQQETFDMIISNPPYVLESEQQYMSRNVLDFEPANALFVPDSDPLIFYDRISQIASQSLKKGGYLLFEINESFGKEMIQLLKDYQFDEIELRQDIHGKDRMIKALKA